MFGNLSMMELLVIFAVVLLVFGSHKVPEMFRNFGRAVNEFKKGMREIDASAAPPPAHPAEVAFKPPQALPPAQDAHGSHH